MFSDGQFGVAYVGHVVECVPGKDMQKALDELYRVADEVYIAHLPDDSLNSRYNPEVRSVIHRAPPTIDRAIDYTDLATGRRQVIKAALRLSRSGTAMIVPESMGLGELDGKTAIRALWRQAVRYQRAAVQDADPVVAFLHVSYAAALSDMLRELSSEEEVRTLTGGSLRKLRSEILALQDAIEGRASSLVSRGMRS